MLSIQSAQRSFPSIACHVPITRSRLHGDTIQDHPRALLGKSGDSIKHYTHEEPTAIVSDTTTDPISYFSILICPFAIDVETFATHSILRIVVKIKLFTKTFESLEN